MQQSSLILFCEKCGAANTTQANTCFACKEPLDTSSSPLPQQPFIVTPVNAPSVVQASAPTLLNGRYDIVSEIGQGGFGIVYKARDTKQKNKLVAVKQINLNTLTPRQIIDATDTYNREVQLLPTLRHKNLPRVYDHFTDPEHWYIVMEFIKGETLEDYLQKTKGGLPLRKVLNIGIQLCTVLNYLHIQVPPIIFRDMKPANIMRTPGGRLYLIDFGIARHFNAGQTRDTGALGSPGYAAPEQYGTAQTTVQTDIYSLGATLQTLLTGKDPLETITGSPSTSHRSIPKKMQALLDQMLERDLNQRPKSMIEVRHRLLDLKEGRSMLSYVKGLLIGSLPYLLMMVLLFVSSIIPPSFIEDLNTLFLSLSLLLLFTWPIVFLAQIITAIRLLFIPHRRLLALGILTMLGLLVLALVHGWLPLPPRR